MFGKQREKSKPEAAVAISLKWSSEFDEVPRQLSITDEPPSTTKQNEKKEDVEIISTVTYSSRKGDTQLKDKGKELKNENEEYVSKSPFEGSDKSYSENDEDDEEYEHDEDQVSSSFDESENENEIDDSEEPPLSRITRRKSVFAEAYNPEEEEDESERIIHAKSDEQRIRLSENVRNIFLFRSLDPDQIGEVLDAMFERKVTENEYVIKQGDDGDNFYVIESGIYNIFVEIDPSGPPKLVGKYEHSGSFGELALMYNLPRAATIQAVTTGSLWAMDRQTFRRIVLNAAYKKRKMYESLLEKVPMLKALQNYERMNLADALVPRIKTAGELIIKQGDAADGMYFVEEGSVRVVMVNSDNQEKEISRVNVGGYFGELALVTKKPRAASVYAVDKVRLAFLDVEAFERLLGPCMDIMKRNIEDYENELLKIFGSQANISDIR
ncbi:UNVERIFIED_CONTAM: hypothetical protein RMT77_003284 [Armadillidium vulgare]